MVRNPFKIYEFSEVSNSSGLRRDHAILDLGCGKGHWTISLARHCRSAIGVDTSERKIAQARNFLRRSRLKDRVCFLCTRLEEAGLPAASLDRVFSFCVLEHVEDLRAVLIEVFKLLKPGGQIHASVDSLASFENEALVAKHKRGHSVVRYFTEASLRRELREVGFEVMAIYPILKNEFAKQEFEKRIHGSYKRGLISRLGLCQEFRKGDLLSEDRDGIMLVARAQRPNDTSEAIA
jgi:2-polyprenyl-3-methyl-5-hydroxy-6-metoxy-1,4-benzoquinol methylase